MGVRRTCEKVSDGLSDGVTCGTELLIAWREDGEGETVDGDVLRRRQEVEDEEERREQWISYYVANGDLDKARELGWTDPSSLPAWKQHEIQQQEALQASIPTMLDLD